MLFKNKKIKQELERQKEAEAQRELERKRREEELALERRKHEQELSRIETERMNANPVNKYKFSEPEPKPKELLSVLKRMLQKTFPDAKKAFLLLTQYNEKSGYLLIVDIDARFLKIINLYLDGETKPVRNSLPIECILYSKSGSLTEGIDPFYVKQVSEPEKNKANKEQPTVKAEPVPEVTEQDLPADDPVDDIVFTDMPEFAVKGNLPQDDRFPAKKNEEVSAAEKVESDEAAEKAAAEKAAAEKAAAEKVAAEKAAAEKAAAEKAAAEKAAAEKATAEKAAAEKAAAEKAAAEKAAAEKAAAEKAAAEKAAAEKAAAEKAAAEKAAAEKAAAEKAAAEKAAAEKAAVEKAAAEKAAAEKAAAEKAAAEKAAAEKAAAEKAAAEKAAAEKVAAEKAAAEKAAAEKAAAEKAAAEKAAAEKAAAEKVAAEKAAAKKTTAENQKSKSITKSELFEALNKYGLSPDEESLNAAKGAFGEFIFYIPYNDNQGSAKIFDDFPSDKEITLTALINMNNKSRAIPFFTAREDAEAFAKKQKSNLVCIKYESFKAAHQNDILRLDSFDGIIINPNSENIFLPCDYPIV